MTARSNGEKELMASISKSIRHFLLVQLVFSLLLPGSAVSQTALDLNEALGLVKQNNLTLRQQKESERIAILEESVQKAVLLPALNLSFTSDYLSEVNEIDLSQALGVAGRRVALGGHDRSELRLNIEQPLFTGFRLRSRVDLAKNAALSEQAKSDVLSNEIYHQVYLLFYQFQSLSRQRQILEESLRRLNVQLENVRNLFEAAQVTAFDTLHVFNQALTIKIELQDVRQASRLTTLQMARILNLPQRRPILEVELAPPSGGSNGGFNLDLLKSQALQKRPELRSIRLAKNGAAIQEKLQRSSYFPSVFAHGNLHFARPGLDPVKNEWMDYYSVGVTVQWNLWRWHGDRNKVEAAQIEYNRLSLAEKDLLRTIDYEVEESFENLNFSLEELGLTEDLEKQERERYRIISVQHQEGIASTNDLLTAETDLTRAELRTKQALIKYYISLAGLKKAVGSINEDT